MYGFTYITTNLINGMKYIGRRKYDKYGVWKSYIGSGRAFKKAVEKYGKENFRREIIAEYETPEELNAAEEELIKQHNAVEDRNYYNLSEGGNVESGYHIPEAAKKIVAAKIKASYTPERKKQYSNRMKLNNPNADGHVLRGKKLSEKICKQMSERMKGRPGLKGEANPMYGKCGVLHHGYGAKSHMARSVRCVETNQIFSTLREAGEFYNTSGSQISLACKGINKTCMGYHWEYVGVPKISVKHSEETKKRISQRKLGRNNPMSKPVLCIETGVIYSAAYEAGRVYNIKGESISACCKGRTHTSAKMHWRYLTNEENERYKRKDYDEFGDDD